MRWLALPGDLAGLAAQPWAALTWGVTNIEPGFFGLLFFGFGLAWLSLLGRDIEQEGGAHRLVGVYVLGTLGGTLLAMAATGFRTGAPAVGGMGVYAGIWGPLLALLCYTAVLHPDRPIGLMFIGAVALKWIAIVIVVLELAFQKDPSHLGAALVGALVGLAEKRGTDLTGWARPLFRARRAAASAARPGGRRAARPAAPRCPARRMSAARRRWSSAPRARRAPRRRTWTPSSTRSTRRGSTASRPRSAGSWTGRGVASVRSRPLARPTAPPRAALARCAHPLGAVGARRRRARGRRRGRALWRRTFRPVRSGGRSLPPSGCPTRPARSPWRRSSRSSRGAAGGCSSTPSCSPSSCGVLSPARSTRPRRSARPARTTSS